MSIISFDFLVFVFFGLIVYYVFPKRFQWICLLSLSVFYYVCATEPITILYLVTSTFIAYVSTLLCKGRGGRGDTIRFVVTIIAVAINVMIWFFVKGKDIWSIFLPTRIVQRLDIGVTGALGMGYYTLQIVGYIIDCYWENEEPQRNPMKLFLFVTFFPQLTTGPISRYEQLKTIYDGRKLDYKNLCFGAQRILWGFIKKMVLAERLDIIISTIQTTPQDYTGYYSWIVILIFPLQMYADFSGCMDIILGVAEMFGIVLPENFNNPFFSRTSQEFWQRWHITLGSWAKTYVLFPLLKSKGMVSFGKTTKKHFGRKISKYLVSLVGMFFLWLIMGVWHGGIGYIVGVSLWYWVILMLGELFAPLFNKVTNTFCIDTECFGWHLFQSIRTYIIYAIGANFFLNGVDGGIALLKDAFRVFFDKEYANPWIFFNENLLKLGIEYSDLNIIIVMVALLLVVAFLREKNGYCRTWIAKQPFVLRWLVWIRLFVFLIVWGKYGPGYSAAEFIYRGF